MSTVVCTCTCTVPGVVVVCPGCWQPVGQSGRGERRREEGGQELWGDLTTHSTLTTAWTGWEGPAPPPGGSEGVGQWGQGQS